MQMLTVNLGDPCGCMEAQFRVFVDPPPIAVEGGTTVSVIEETQEGEGDEQMDGYFTDGGYYAVRAEANPIVVRVMDRAVPTMLVRVHGIGAVQGDTIAARMGSVLLEAGVDFLATPSNDPALGFYLFLARELPPDVVLEIEYG